MTDFRDRMIAVRTIVYFWMQRRRKQPCFQDAVNPSFRAAKLKSLSEIQRVSGGGIHTGNWPGRDPVSCARRAFWGLPFNRFWPEAFPGRNWIARLASAGKPARFCQIDCRRIAGVPCHMVPIRHRGPCNPWPAVSGRTCRDSSAVPSNTPLPVIGSRSGRKPSGRSASAGAVCQGGSMP